MRLKPETLQHRRTRLAVAILFAAGLAHAAAAEVDPEADGILRAMSDYMTGVSAFSVDLEATTDVLLHDGRMIQLSASSEALVDRAAGFRVIRNGPVGAVSVSYDNATLSVASERANAYLQVPVEGGIGAALDEMRAIFGTEVTGGADLFYENPYGGLMNEVIDGEVIGQTMVGGVLTNHLYFQAKDVDWQIWISAEGDPVPLRYVITSKWVAGGPQFEVRLSNFDTSVAPAADDFAFAPASAAREIAVDDFDSLNLLIEE